MFIYITYPNVRLAPTFSTYVCSVLFRRQTMNFPPSGWIMKHATPRKNFATVSPSHVCPTGRRHFCKQATTHDRHIRASSLSFTPQAPPHMRCKICAVLLNFVAQRSLAFLLPWFAVRGAFFYDCGNGGRCCGWVFYPIPCLPRGH